MYLARADGGIAINITANKFITARINGNVVHFSSTVKMYNINKHILVFRSSCEYLFRHKNNLCLI